MSDSSAEAKASAGLEETKAQIRFALNQLSAANRHHEFEHLARTLARTTVSRNVLPATGPVSSGGDQGRDFETYRSELAGQALPLARRFGIADSDSVGFCCTLQQENVLTKLGSDVAKILSEGTTLTFVIAYCEANVPTASRHTFQERMRKEHDVHVEVFDGTAIAELLAQRHTFWIAEQYLHLSARALPGVFERPDWYEDDLARWRQASDPIFTVGHLVDLTPCLRYATFHDEASEDLPFWLDKMELLLREDVPPQVRAKAQYEISVAHLRGLGDMRPSDALVTDFMRVAVASDEPSELRDGAVLVAYVMGAHARGLTNHDPQTIMRWNATLVAQTTALLDDADSPGRICALLDVLSFLQLQPDLIAIRDLGINYDLPAVVPRLSAAEWEEAVLRGEARPLELPLVDRDGALDSLLRLSELLEAAPLFPVEPIADTIQLQSHNLVDDSRFDIVVTAIDERIAEVEGRVAAGERARDRAMRFYEMGRLLDALREIHRARSAWFSGEGSRGMILATLVTSEIYSRLHLHAAAKYFALAAASLTQEPDLDLFPRALFKASAADYHQGAWISAVQLAIRAIEAHELLAQQPFDVQKHEDLSNALFELQIVLAVAEKLEDKHAEFVKTSLDAADLTAVLARILEGVDPWWDRLSADELVARVKSEMGQGPFSDVGPRRRLDWLALGVHWTVEFENSYQHTLVAERFAAGAQVILAELAIKDPALIPTHVTWTVEAVSASGELGIDFESDGTGSTWRIQLPEISDPSHDSYQLAASSMVALMRAAVENVSVLPSNDVAGMFESLLEAGLMNNLVFGSVFDVAFRSALDKESFDAADRVLFDSVTPPAIDMLKTGVGLEFPESPGPGFTDGQGENMAQHRYEQIVTRIQATLSALANDANFLEIVRELRNEGWLDWQLLLAVFNVAVNERLRSGSAPNAIDDPIALQQWVQRVEDPDDPIDPSVFTAPALRQSLSISLASTVSQLGLELHQNPPDLDALQRLLVRRYGYDADVDHADPFELEP